MAQGKQTKLSLKKKVIQAKMNDPELSLRDIEAQTGVSRQTANEIIKEVPELLTGTDKGAKMIEDLEDIISTATRITRKHLRQLDDKESLTTKDTKLVNEIAKINFDRKQLLTGQATERVDHTVIDFGTMTKAQKEAKRKELLGR